MVERRKACKKYFSVFFYKNPITDPTFFLYIKLLISLLNVALFRLGETFSVRGHGAKFWATLPHQLFKADSRNPLRLLLRSRFGEKQTSFTQFSLSLPWDHVDKKLVTSILDPA